MLSEFHVRMSDCYSYPTLRHLTPNASPGVSQHTPDYIRVIITTDSHGRKRKLLIPAALDLDRPKRPRTTFQNWQIQAMEKEFQKTPFICEEERRVLAKSLGITETQVKVWFQNRRTKVRKDIGKDVDVDLRR